jgi:BASS family bile acid:Na+ symporter
MDLKQLILLALQLSILAMVFAFGLKATTNDLLYVIRRPGLLIRSLLSVLVVMPVLAVLLVNFFDFPRPVKVVIIALAISPVPPILPRKEAGAGGNLGYALGLMAILSLVSIVAIPLILEIIERLFGLPLASAPGTVAGMVMKTTLLPLLAGTAVRAHAPAFADRIERPVKLLANVLLPIAVLALLGGAMRPMWEAIGNGTILVMVIFTVAGLAVGHLLGGPDPNHAVVLALSTACRHPAIALTLASVNYPDLKLAPIILLYLVVNALAGIPYVKWQRPGSAAVSTA